MDAYKLFIEAFKKWKKGHRRDAFTGFLQAARLGDSSAQHNVGLFYAEGIGTKIDTNKALYWYKKSWRNGGQSDTCINIANVYGKKGNLARRIFWLKKAVDQGDGDAALDLGEFYLGRKRPSDLRRAYHCLNKACVSKSITEYASKKAAKLLRKHFPLRA